MKKMLPSNKDQELFANHLWTKYTEKGDVLYSHGKNLPSVKESETSTVNPLIVHLVALGFDQLASFKPGPGSKLFKLLLEHILKDGFVTASEPLLVVQSRDPSTLPSVAIVWEDGSDLPTFSLVT